MLIKAYYPESFTKARAIGFGLRKINITFALKSDTSKQTIMTCKILTVMLFALPLYAMARQEMLRDSTVQEQTTTLKGVIANQLTHVPQRGVCISMSNGKTITTPWDGKYCISDTAFTTASISKNGFLTRHLRRDEFTDTLFLLPAAHTIAEVTVWGKRGNHANLFTPMSKTDAELAGIGGNMGGNIIGLLILAAEKLKLIPDPGKKRRRWEEKQRMIIENY